MPKVTVEKISRVVLELTEDEARTLRAIAGKDRGGSSPPVMANIFRALQQELTKAGLPAAMNDHVYQQHAKSWIHRAYPV